MEDPQQQEDSEERAVTPAEVWEQLSPDVQERVCSLFARMAYKYALAQSESLPEGAEVRDEIRSYES
jgi:hypothetical protein